MSLKNWNARDLAELIGGADAAALMWRPRSPPPFSPIDFQADDVAC
jgi:hypothetical protein